MPCTLAPKFRSKIKRRRKKKKKSVEEQQHVKVLELNIDKRYLSFGLRHSSKCVFLIFRT